VLAAKADVKAPPKALALPAPSLGDPTLEKQRLLVQAREGLPVSGVPATSWEALRPKIVGKGEADKVGLVGLDAAAMGAWVDAARQSMVVLLGYCPSTSRRSCVAASILCTLPRSSSCCRTQYPPSSLHAPPPGARLPGVQPLRPGLQATPGAPQGLEGGEEGPPGSDGGPRLCQAALTSRVQGASCLTHLSRRCLQRLWHGPAADQISALRIPHPPGAGGQAHRGSPGPAAHPVCALHGVRHTLLPPD
jgi:hypothetical protein